MRILRRSIEKLVSSLPVARRAQLVDLALSHVGEAAYYRLANQGFRPNGIIDIGAYEGNWTRLIAKIYPQTPILMIEAQLEKKAFLDRVRAELPLADHILCLLGNNEGVELVFNVMETGSSIYGERSNIPRVKRLLTTRTLSGILKEYQLREPLFIKLDVQGAELDVLRGGENALQAAEVVQLEIALMPYNEGAPNANTVFQFMAERNFLIFDVSGFVRPNPSCLAQIDVLFVRADSKLRSNYFAF